MIPKRSLQRRPAQHAIPDNNHNGVDDRMETMQSYQQHATSYQQPVEDEPEPMRVPLPAPVHHDNVPVNHTAKPPVISDAEIMQRNNMMIRNVMGIRTSGNRPNPRFQPEQQNTVMPAPVPMQSGSPERGIPMDRMNAPQVYTEQDGVDPSWNQNEFGQLMDEGMRSMNAIDSDDYGTVPVDDMEPQEPDDSMQYNENANDNPVQPVNGYNMKSSVPVDEPLGNLSADELYGTPDNEPPVNNTQQSTNNGRKSNSLLFIIGGVLLAVLAIGATIILM